uniref:Uncharacterized protein n=1 Tax=Rhizophagus irregularis (strain DAOM 181602 / DAOM 197198 / MUCL 43194) TaxID=747089 RepID=U9U3M4_RHIID
MEIQHRRHRQLQHYQQQHINMDGGYAIIYPDYTPPSINLCSIYIQHQIQMKNLYGYILEDRSNHYNWNISYPILTNFNGDILILPNNTLATSQLITRSGARDNVWNFMTIQQEAKKICQICMKD